MQIDAVSVTLVGVIAGGLVAIALVIAFFRYYTNDPQFRSSEMAWKRAIRLDWILLLFSACALADAIVQATTVPATRPWMHPLLIACVVLFAAVSVTAAIILVIAYRMARTQSRSRK